MLRRFVCYMLALAVIALIAVAFSPVVGLVLALLFAMLWPAEPEDVKRTREPDPAPLTSWGQGDYEVNWHGD